MLVTKAEQDKNDSEILYLISKGFSTIEIIKEGYRAEAVRRNFRKIKTNGSNQYIKNRKTKCKYCNESFLCVALDTSCRKCLMKQIDSSRDLYKSKHFFM